ncbi:MAG: hypothetical protein WC608_01375 [Parcubacteria group bacterium]
MNAKKTFLILFLIVVLGFSLRAYKLDANSFVTDEFLDINASYGYYKTGHWLAWDFNMDRVSDNLFAPRDERAWPYRWQVAQLFRWFPPTETVARSISVAWGVISIVIIYFVGKYFTGKREIGLLSAFLFAVSALGISIDRALRMYAMFMPVFLLFSCFLFRFFEEEYRGKIKIFKKIYGRLGLNAVWLLPVLATGIISWYVHILTANIAIAFFFYLLVSAVVSFKNKRSVLTKYSASLFAMLLGAVIFIIFFPKEAAWYSLVVKFFKFNSKYFLAIVGDYANYILAYGLIFWGTFSLFKKSEDHRAALWISCMFFAILIPAFLVWNYVFGERLIFFILPFGIILLSSGIYYLAEFFAKNSLRFKIPIFIGVLGFFLLILPDYSRFFTEKNFYRQESDNPDYRKMFSYVKKNGASGDFLIARNFRSFYYQKLGFRVIDVGGERKISQAKLDEIISQNSAIWTIFDDGKGTFEDDALKFVKNNFRLVKKFEDNNIYYLPANR